MPHLDINPPLCGRAAFVSTIMLLKTFMLINCERTTEENQEEIQLKGQGEREERGNGCTDGLLVLKCKHRK